MFTNIIILTGTAFEEMPLRAITRVAAPYVGEIEIFNAAADVSDYSPNKIYFVVLF